MTNMSDTTTNPFWTPTATVTDNTDCVLKIVGTLEEEARLFHMSIRIEEDDLDKVLLYVRGVKGAKASDVHLEEGGNYRVVILLSQEKVGKMFTKFRKKSLPYTLIGVEQVVEADSPLLWVTTQPNEGTEEATSPTAPQQPLPPSPTTIPGGPWVTPWVVYSTQIPDASQTTLPHSSAVRL